MNYYGLKLNHNKCLCPFHNDNNPSMVVNHKKNIATCFACGTGGNAISFVQKYEKIINNNDISVNEAITKVVSEICHLDINVSHLKKNKYNNKYSVSSRRYTEEEQKLLQLNEKLNKLFSYNLSVSKEPKDYLYKRKLNDKDMKDISMGFAPKGQLLKISENNENYPRSALIELGYLRLNDYGDLYETFSDRIMIPIHDEKGNIVTFCGRTIKDETPKYLHTPETKLFQKKELLYNFSSAKPLAYNNELILVEGYMDVVGAKKVGFENVAALMGTALTPEHIKLIKNNRSTITLALDNDFDKPENIGRTKMLQHIPVLLNEGFKVDVIDFSKIGDYKDFGVLGENEIPFMEVQKAKTSGFSYLLDYKYFNGLELNVENISLVYKQLKEDKIINNTYDESLFKEYLLDRTEYYKKELDEILYPKKIVEKENALSKFNSKAMSNFLYSELKLQIDKMDDIVLSSYYSNFKSSVESRLVSIFNKDPEMYLDYNTSTLNTKLLLNEFLKDNKEYSDFETLNRFKYTNVFDKTYIKNSNGSAMIRLKDNQKQMVIDQYENSLSDESKLALEEVEELYIINSIEDLDGILNYDNNTLHIIKDSLKDRMFLNKDKMEFFKYGNLFPSINKEFIDDKFKGSTGNFKTVLFYNNLDNKLNIDKSNVITEKEAKKIQNSKVKEFDRTNETIIKQDYEFSINKMLLVESKETDTHYFVRIPFTSAKEYFYIPKSECLKSDNGDTIFTKLKYGQSYPIYNLEGEYVNTKSFDELKENWEDKTKKNVKAIETNEEITSIPKEDDILYDNSYISKYKEPICKIYHSKIYLETEKGFYIKTEDPNVLLFAIKKICNWTDNKSYLIIAPRKGLFNSGFSKYRLTGFKKDYEGRLSFSEISKYVKVFTPSNLKNKEVLVLEVPKTKCSFKSNYIKIPLVIDNIEGYIEVNLVKSKVNKEKVVLEFLKDEQIGFHNINDEYINHYTSSKVIDSYNEMLNNNIIQFPSPKEVVYDVPEKEVA
ncbi:MAG: toprim domain-containing protein [Bacilli bacterium]|nr:toprim domain-containing protein [Bacilli bacterium]